MVRVSWEKGKNKRTTDNGLILIRQAHTIIWFILLIKHLAFQVCMFSLPRMFYFRLLVLYMYCIVLYITYTSCIISLCPCSFCTAVSVMSKTFLKSIFYCDLSIFFYSNIFLYTQNIIELYNRYCTNLLHKVQVCISIITLCKYINTTSLLV